MLVHRNELVQQVKSAMGGTTTFLPHVAQRMIGGPLATHGADTATRGVEFVPPTTERNKLLRAEGGLCLRRSDTITAGKYHRFTFPSCVGFLCFRALSVVRSSMAFFVFFSGM